MSRINKVAIAVWGAALIAGGAFAYVLNADAPQPIASRIESVPNPLFPAVPLAGAAMH